MRPMIAETNKDKMTPICEKLSLKSKFSNVVILAKSETTINK